MNAGRTSGVGRARVATLTSCSASLPIHQLHRHQQWAFTGDSAYNLIVRQKMVADAQGGDTDKLLGLTAHSSIAQTPTISLHWRLCIQFNCATENGGRCPGCWQWQVARPCCPFINCTDTVGHRQSAFTGDSAYNLIVRQKMVADSDCTVMFGLAAHSLIARTPTISLATTPQLLPWLPTQNTVKLYNRIWWRIVLHCFWQTFDCETAMKSCLWKMHV